MRWVGAVLIGMLCAIGAARAQVPGPVQPWGLPPLPAGVGPVEKFADVSGTPQGQFLEGGAFDNQGNMWFVAIGGPDNQHIYFEGATSGTFGRFEAPYPGLIGPGGVRLPAQQ
jgi:hypothetical protein